MTSWVIIPVKAPDEGKTRLAGVLDSAGRTELIGRMLARVVNAAKAARTVGRICLVGTARFGQGEDLMLLPDPGTGLNPALTAALATAAQQGASRVLILFADLPQVTALEVELLLSAPADTIAIAPDRHATGTNALSLPLPAAQDFAFAFGPDSFGKHNGEALRLGLQIEEVRSPGLARDIDEPGDLPDAKTLMGD